MMSREMLKVLGTICAILIIIISVIPFSQYAGKDWVIFWMVFAVAFGAFHTWVVLRR